MKTFCKKRFLLLALNCLLCCCIQVKNVKFIVDDQALFGFEIDLSDMEIELFSSAQEAKNTLEEEVPQRPERHVQPVQASESRP